MTIIWRRNNYTFYLSLLFVFHKIGNRWIPTIIYKLINYVLFASMSKLLWPAFRFKYFFKPFILAETHRQSSQSYRYYYYVVGILLCMLCLQNLCSLYTRSLAHRYMMLFIRFAYLCNNNNFWTGIHTILSIPKRVLSNLS